MCGSELMTPLRRTSSEGSELTTRERLSICCKPSFRLRKLKNKGAILVLLWSFLCLSVPFFFYSNKKDNHWIHSLVQVIVFSMTLSIAGWIADVRFGRYRVIKLSMWIMWAAIMLDTVSSVLTRAVDSYTSKMHRCMSGVLWTIIAIGFGGFQANVIQFGMDQLHDSSSDEITSFIVWCVWTYYSNGLVVYVIFECLPNQYWIIGNIVMCVYLSVALSLMLVFNHWVVKEPVTQNPFKLVYSVIRYAVKHKHPECRSAFTYCEDEPPSRIDFGKSKYGGPFTTEQVEDVKTFLRSFVVICVGVVIFGIIMASTQLLKNVSNLLVDSEGKSLLMCYSKEGFINIFSYSCVIILPLFELIFYPLFRRCLEVISSYCRWRLMGIFFPITEFVSLLVIETVARHNYLVSSSYNTTIPCTGHGTLSTSMDFRWMIIPQVLYSLSTSVIIIKGCIFISSQVPYSMRGLIVGTACCLLVLCGALGTSIRVPFSRQLSIWGTGIISCGFWYALLLLVVGLVAGFLHIATHRWYKKRKREDVLPNEHIFAERYYDRDS